DAPLENTEAFVRIGGEAQIHARLEILQLRPAIQNAVEGHFEVGFEKEGYIRQRGEIVNAAHPLRRATAHHVARVGGKDVAIAEHKVAGTEQRHEMALVAISKVR